jgi:transcriptional regulator with XRE-family HTH domain
MAGSEAVAPASSMIYSRIVDDVRAGSITTAELADVTGVSERQVQNWAAGSSRPQGPTRDKLLELHYIIEKLKEVYTSEGVEIWLHARNRSLVGQRPIDLLRDDRFREVLDAVERLTVGAM